jgi:hypothetical protein
MKHVHDSTLSGLIGHLYEPDDFIRIAPKMQKFVLACEDLFQELKAGHSPFSQVLQDLWRSRGDCKHVNTYLFLF